MNDTELNLGLWIDGLYGVRGELLIKPQSAADKDLDSDSADGIYPV